MHTSPSLVKLPLCSTVVTSAARSPVQVLRVGEHVRARLGERVGERVVDDLRLRDVVLKLREVAVVEVRVAVEQVVLDVGGVVAERAVVRVEPDAEDDHLAELEAHDRVRDLARAVGEREVGLLEEATPQRAALRQLGQVVTLEGLWKRGGERY